MDNKIASDISLPAVAEENETEIAVTETKKISRFGRLWAEYGYLAAAFLLPALLMWLIYITMETYPFGDGSVLVLDLNGQYIYFFEALRNAVRQGGSLVFSFSRCLGGDFMGIYAYYLASPFSWLTALFPDNTMTEALLIMFLMKCGCCGVTFGYYIHKTRPGANRISTVIFSIMYALSAYAVVQQHNTMWIDCVIYLPLLTLGIENLIKYGRYKLFVAVLALSILSNFYIGYMMCIYVVIYAACYWYAHTGDGQNNPTGEPKHFLHSFIRLAVYSILGAGIAAVIIFGAYYSLTFGKTTFSNPVYNFTQQWDFLDIFTKLFPGSYDTVRPEGTPFIYCGVFTLLMVPAFFMSKKISAREKTGYGILLAIFTVSFNVYVIDIFWHGLQRPNWLNCRYSFMFCFILLVMGFRAYEEIKDIKFGQLFGISAFYILALLIIQKLDYESMPDFEAIWLSIACIAVYLIASRAAARSDSVNHSSMVILVLVCLELFTAGCINVNDLDADVVFSSRSSYVSFMERWRPVYAQLKEYDDGFYRSEKTVHLKTNDSMTLGYYGLSGSTSTLNAKTIKFLAKMGLCSKSHWSKYLGGTPAEDSLLGLKYIISDQEVSPLYKEAFSVESDSGSVTAYENPYALSIATAASSDVKSLHMDNYDNPFDYMNAMVTYLTGSKTDIELFVPVRLRRTSEDNVTLSYVVGHKKFSKDGTSGEPTLSFSFDVPEKEVQLYAYFASEYPRECNMRVNDMGNGTYFGNETMRIVTVGKRGEFTQDNTDEIRIDLVLKEEMVYLANKSSNYLYYLDEDVLARVMTDLRQNSFEIDDDYSQDHLKGTITTTGDRKTVFTTLAYDKGWHIKVDGVEVETYEVTDALIAFDVPNAGRHTLEMTYLPSALTYGRIISLCCLILFAAIWFLDCYLRKKKKEQAERDGTTDSFDATAVVFPLSLAAPKADAEEKEEGDGTGSAAETAGESAEESAEKFVKEPAEESAEEPVPGETTEEKAEEEIRSVTSEKDEK